MKTVFITITRGILARNILRTGILDFLLEPGDVKVVILVPMDIQDYFKKEFNHPNIVVEQVPDPTISKSRKFFNILFNGLVYTESEKRMLKFGGGKKGPVGKVSFWVRHLTFSLLNKIKFLRCLARWIEQYLFIEKDYDYLFQKYNPQVVFCSSIYSKVDVILIKAAKRLGVFSISMPKSWDTIGRLFFRAPSDIMVVHNQLMKNWIAKEQLIKEDKIIVCGIPQFDIYHNKKNYLSKEEFCRRTDLDSSKAIILFVSEGPWISWDAAYLDDLINNHGLLEKYNLIIRPYFTDVDKKLFERFKKFSNVYVDDENLRITDMFGDRWDPTAENMDWLAEVINVSDVMITFFSTVALEGVIKDKLVINIYYDLSVEDKNFIPMKEIYNCFHCNTFMDENSTVLANSGKEIMEWIEKYLEDKKILSREREKTKERLCYKIDGSSSYRIAQTVLKYLKKD